MFIYLLAKASSRRIVLFQGKTVVVTGASRGIGKAIAQKFLSAGANVVLFARNEELLRQVPGEYVGREFVVAGDINEAEDRQRLVQSALTRFGRIDVFVPAAGIVEFVPLEQTTDQILQKHLVTNFTSIVALTNLIIPHLSTGGSIVFVSTSITTGGFPGLAAYSASKGALEAYMRTAAVELAPRGIIVNTVAPGPTKTEMWSNALPAEVLAQVGAQIGPRLLTRDFCDPEYVADAVALLAQTPTIRGQRIVLDAGYGIN